MIKTYKLFNESLKDKLKGKSKKEIEKSLSKYIVNGQPIIFDDVKINDNVIVIGYPNGNLVTIQSKIRNKNIFSITLWWYGGEFIINKNDISFIYLIDKDKSYSTEELLNIT